MYRSLTNRILGGVCGGLERMTRLSGWLWRLLFVVLTLVTMGGAAGLYLALWWLAPAAMDERTQDKRPLNIVIIVILALLVIGGWFARSQLISPIGNQMYPYGIFLLLGLIFFLRQLLGARRERTNIIIGLVTFAVTIVLALGAWGIIPNGIYNLLLRSAPALLVFYGLAILLRDRLAIGGIVALIVSVGLVAGLTYTAFSTRATQQRDDNQVTTTEEISETITLVQVNVETLGTDVEFLNAVDAERAITTNFTGSNASDIQIDYSEDESGLATFTLREVQVDAVPSLEDIGRGTLRLELPTDVALAISFAADDGQITLNLADLNLERLDLNVTSGDALVTLPDYQPLSPSVAQDPGSLVLFDGNLTLVVPEDVGGEFLLTKAANNRPEFDDLLYALEDNVSDWRLIARGFDTFDTQIRYLLTAPQGSIRLEVE